MLGLFALGGAVLWGLYQAPRATSPAAPPATEWGAPDRPVRVASFNALHLQRGLDAVVAEVRKVEPDFVLLQEVDSRDVVSLAAALGMRQHHHPNAFERSANLAGPKATWGNVIFAKHSLYDAGPIPNPGGGSFGVWATTVVDGKKFVVANVHLSAAPGAGLPHVNASGGDRGKEIANLLRAWHERGSPPIVAGGNFNQTPTGNSYGAMAEHLNDALTRLAEYDVTLRAGLLDTRVNYLLTSPEWAPVTGGVVMSDSSDHPLIWADLGATAGAAATRPATTATW